MSALETIHVNRNASIWVDLTDATVHLATSWMAFQMTIQLTVSVSICKIEHFSNVTKLQIDTTPLVGYGASSVSLN